MPSHLQPTNEDLVEEEFLSSFHRRQVRFQRELLVVTPIW